MCHSGCRRGKVREEEKRFPLEGQGGTNPPSLTPNIFGLCYRLEISVIN